jgi:hypothetical protein
MSPRKDAAKNQAGLGPADVFSLFFLALCFRLNSEIITCLIFSSVKLESLPFLPRYIENRSLAASEI